MRLFIPPFITAVTTIVIEHRHLLTCIRSADCW